MINSRRNRNGITGLEIGGTRVDDPTILKKEITEHFKSQFSKMESGDRGGDGLDRLEQVVNARLDEQDGVWLTRDFSEEEVREAVWDCEGSKSPGPDGYNLNFFKECWSIIKDDLMRVMREFFENGKLSRGCNSSFIVLIPKKEGACDLRQLRPISLKLLQKYWQEG